jgi:hypothetical protein
MAEFNFNSVFEIVFGYQAPAKTFSIPTATARKEQSLLGQKLFATDVIGREFFLPVEIGGVLIPFAVISMNARKTIVETPMPERGGSVHELISIDDYTFNVKGLVIDEDGGFPDAGITELHKLFLVNTSVRLQNALSAIALQNGELVIIKEIKWPPTPGVEHVRAFEMDLVSDQIFELELR